MQKKTRQSPCYCINLRRVASKVTNLYDQHLKATGLTVSQFSLLINVGRLEVCSIIELADFIGLEKTTLVRTLKPLLEDGLITDAAPPGTRNRQMSLSEKGQKALAKGLPLWQKAQIEIEKKLGADNAAKLSELFSILSKV